MALLRINRQPSRGQLLLFCIAWLGFVGVFALIAWTRGRNGVAAATAVAAFIPTVLWAMRPEFVRGLFVGLSYATYPLGFVLSYLVLGILYYGVFTPVGLVMRLCGRDPLVRNFDPKAATYWEARSRTPGPASYLRQR